MVGARTVERGSATGVEFTVYLHILGEFWGEIVEKMKGFGGPGAGKGGLEKQTRKVRPTCSGC